MSQTGVCLNPVDHGPCHLPSHWVHRRTIQPHSHENMSERQKQGLPAELSPTQPASPRRCSRTRTGRQLIELFIQLPRPQAAAPALRACHSPNDLERDVSRLCLNTGPSTWGLPALERLSCPASVFSVWQRKMTVRAGGLELNPS